MRSALVALLVAAVPLFAGTSLGTLVADTTLKGSPRADSVDAGSLAAGSSVIIHHEEGDWLALQPPRGCVSWISHLFIEFPDKAAAFPKNAVVRSEGEVKLAVGRPGHPKPLDVRKTAVPEGTIVLVIGPPVKLESDNSTWFPIIPPDEDFRYVPKTAVKLASGSAPSFVVKSPAASPTISAMSPPPALIAGPGTVGKTHPLWIQAEEAEKAGDWDRAERLYFQLAKEMNGPGGDSELANQCYSRVHGIREKRRATPPGTSSNWKNATGTVTPAKAETVTKADVITKTDAPVEAPEKKLTRDEITLRDKTEPKGQWSGSGFLRIAGFKVGGKQAYALEDNRGRLLYYAIANGVDLDRYRNKTVDLFGTVTTPKDLRGVSLMEATKIDTVK